MFYDFKKCFTLSVLSSQGIWPEETDGWIDLGLRFCQEEGSEVRGELIILTKVIKVIDHEY